jgi:3-hydroxyacyl-[acyl-carrier-protein] dehydratase
MTETTGRPGLYDFRHGHILSFLYGTERAGDRMRFHLIDRIDRWEPGKALSATKYLALGEEYLADHFPQFPVMPGVLMLQACVEAAAWLWRATTDYQHPVIVLRELKSVKYGTFMLPGRRMDVKIEWAKAKTDTADEATFKGWGTNDVGEATVTAIFKLHGYSLARRGPAGAAADAKLLEHWKTRWALLTGQLRGK